jgi:hypothetical protein
VGTTPLSNVKTAWIALSWLLAALLATVFLSPLQRISPPDFPSYYFAGRMVVTGELSELYKKEAYERRWAEVLAQGQQIVPYPNFFIRPAFAAYLCAPLGLLSYQTAWLFALILNFAALGVLTWKFPVWFGGCELSSWYPWLAVFMPFLWSIGYGQDTIVLTLLVGYCLHLTTKQKDVAAGMILGVCTVKPHLIWALPVVLLVGRRYKCVAAFLATALVLAAVSVAAVGVDGTADWVHLILDEQTDFVPHSMFNIRALWVRLGSIAGAAATLVVLVAFAVILWLGSFRQQASAAILASLLLSPHTYNQDASLAALLPFLNPTAAVRYAVFLPWPYFDPAKDPRNLIMVALSLLYLAVVSLRLLRSCRSQRPCPIGLAAGDVDDSTAVRN